MDNNLRPEVLECLFIHVSNPYDLFTLRLICREWQALIINERFLTLYFRKRLGSYARQQLEWFDLRICKFTLRIPPYTEKSIDETFVIPTDLDYSVRSYSHKQLFVRNKSRIMLYFGWIHSSLQRHHNFPPIFANLQGNGGIIIDNFGPGHRTTFFVNRLSPYRLFYWYVAQSFYVLLINHFQHAIQ